MNDTEMLNSPSNPSSDSTDSSRSPAAFDRAAARRAAEEEVERARRAQEAVLLFHDASEKIEEAQRVVKDNSRIRSDALATMRECGYSVARIAGLTGLSPSTIQKTLTGGR